MSLFRRRSHGKDDSEPEAERDGAEASPVASREKGSSAAPRSGGIARPPPPSSPPPLPARAPGASSPTLPSERFAQCFVCGSTLDAGTCPKCRIAWVE